MYSLKCTLFLAFLQYGVCEYEILRGCWPANIVPYVIKSGFSQDQIDHIKYQMSIIHNASCVRWQDQSKVDYKAGNYLEITKTTGKNCLLAKASQGTNIVFIIQLSDWCFYKKYVMHELVHALGFDHEQQRADRDCYVVIDPNELKDDQYRFLYRRYDTTWIDRFPYDKYSVMHYSRTYQMKAKTERWFDFWQPLGNLEGVLTPIDIWKILYKFCGYPHFCDIDPGYCKVMDNFEKDCVNKKTRPENLR